MPDAHWVFAENAARMGIQLLLVNPTSRFSDTIYPGIATAFSSDPHLGNEQRDAWNKIRTQVYRRIALEQGIEPTVAAGK